MPNGRPTSSWSATAFSPVFGESAARLPAGLPYRTIVLLPTAMEDRLGAELWGLCQLFRTSCSRQRNEPLRFFAKAKEKNSVELDKKHPNRAILLVGNDDFPLPIPIVKRKREMVL